LAHIWRVAVDVVVVVVDVVVLFVALPGLDGDVFVGCCREMGVAFAVVAVTVNVTAAAMLRHRFSTRACCRSRTGTHPG
jgi:hypothetical protein